MSFIVGKHWKEQYGEIKHIFYAQLTVYILDIAIEYLIQMYPGMCKDRSSLNETIGWLERNRYVICMYAMRGLLNLMVSSNKVYQLSA